MYWSVSEEARLVSLRDHGMTCEEIAAAMDRTFHSVRGKLRKLTKCRMEDKLTEETE